MPNTYPTAQTVQPAVAAKTVELVGVLINTEDKLVTWKFKARDVSGNLVREAEFTETFADLAGEDAKYGVVYAALKAHGYSHVAAAGFPAGGVIL